MVSSWDLTSYMKGRFPWRQNEEGRYPIDPTHVRLGHAPSHSTRSPGVCTVVLITFESITPFRYKMKSTTNLLPNSSMAASDQAPLPILLADDVTRNDPIRCVHVSVLQLLLQQQSSVEQGEHVDHRQEGGRRPESKMQDVSLSPVPTSTVMVSTISFD